MIRIVQLLFENKEENLLDYLRYLLKNSPFEGKVFLAGGAVRDEIMGKPVKDIDVVVSMPDGGIQFANWITQKVGAFRPNSNPVIYPKFGTAKFNLRGVTHNGVDLSGVDIESVMTRGEKYEKGSRKPEVVYADLKDDAFRRDLIVNSLFKDLSTGEIKDFTGMGLKDIEDGIVRTPLDPDQTFKDDPLRMLRAIRFAVKYNWKMPMSMVKALKKNHDMLKIISKERIRDEFDKMMVSPAPDKAIKLLTFTGLNKYIVPELYKCIGVEQNQYHKDDVFDHILEVVKNTEPNLVARLASLFHDIGKPDTKSSNETGVHFYHHEDRGGNIAREAMQRLKYPNDITSAVSKIVDMHMRLKSAGPDGQNISDKALRRFMVDAGSDLDPLLMTMQADNVSHSEHSVMPNQISFLKHRMDGLQSSMSMTGNTKSQLPINGNDIMKTLAIKPGPTIKHLLSKVQDAWYENPSISADDAMLLVRREFEKSSQGQEDNTDVMNQTVKNPETGNDILVKTALKYPEQHDAHKAAISLIQRSKNS